MPTGFITNMIHTLSLVLPDLKSLKIMFPTDKTQRLFLRLSLRLVTTLIDNYFQFYIK